MADPAPRESAGEPDEGTPPPSPPPSGSGRATARDWAQTDPGLAALDEGFLPKLLGQVEALEEEVARLRSERTELLERIAGLEREHRALEEEVQNAGELIERLGAELDGLPPGRATRPPPAKDA